MLNIYKDVYDKLDDLKEVLNRLNDKEFDLFNEDFYKDLSNLTKTVLAMKGIAALEEEK